MNQFIVLSKAKPDQDIRFNIESPFLKITNVVIPSLTKENQEKVLKIISSINITYTKNERDKSVINIPLFSGIRYAQGFANAKDVSLDKICVEDNEWNAITFNYKNTHEEDLEIRLYYETVNNNVSLKNPFETFKTHIAQKDNVKILFSAPFGQGKSTFLNCFFKQHTEEYEVFKVFPVNYSISHNEDVFKYIKAEILFQLLEKNVEFDKETFSYFLTAPQFFKNDPIRVLAPLIKLIPKIGKSAYEIYEQIFKLANEYFDYHDKSQVDDKKTAEKFIEELYEKEGSIFEDNFYTQLIRQQLEKLKLSSQKNNVLIIEDLDRMDPDHIFRILNVFAAHFDAPEFTSGYSNKFGFDKIIIVGDYNNIKHTFAYRYGPEVGFEGYINKYYSREPFPYNNREAISVLIQNIRKGFPQDEPNVGADVFMCVLSDLVAAEKITLRDLLKLQKIDALQIINGQSHKTQKNSKNFYHFFVYYNLFYYLSRVFDIDSLIQKFIICRDKINANPNWNYNFYACLGLPSLVVTEYIDTAEYDFEHKSQLLSFRVHKADYKNSRAEYYSLMDLINETDKMQGKTANIKLNKVDFYDILILNANKYKEVGGFE